MAATDQIEKRKLELVQQIEKSRNSVLNGKLLLDEQITEKKASLKKALNIPQRLKTAFLEKPLKSFSIATASGLTTLLLLKRKSKCKKVVKPVKTSLVSSLTIAVLKPILQRVIMQYSQQWLAQKAKQKIAQATRLPEG